MASSSSSGAVSSSVCTEDGTDLETLPDESSGESDDEAQGKKTVVSLLDRLKCPVPADIGRPRKIKTNDSSRGKRRCRGSLLSDPKRVSPTQRVREFENECLTVTRGDLFCSACHEHLSLKRSIIKNHIQSTKHESHKKRLQRKEARERDIADCLKKYNEQVHPRGETLPEQQQVYRIKVVTAFLKAGIPLNKMDSFRDLLKENALRLTDRRNMHDYVPSFSKKKKVVYALKSVVNNSRLSLMALPV